MANTALATWLAKELEARNMSARGLARRAGVSHTTIVRALSGDNTPSARILRCIADALDVPPEEVLRLTNALDKLPPAVADEREALRYFRQLNREARRAVMATMRSLLGMAPRREERAAEALLEELETLTPAEQDEVFAFMKRLRDGAAGQRGAGAEDVPETTS